MNLNDFEDFLIFTTRMVSILSKNESEYGDTWKESSLFWFKNKIDHQINKLDKFFPELAIRYKEKRRPPKLVMIDLKDTLLDIANYCFFLYTRLEKR